MLLKRVRLQNYRCFKDVEVELAKVTVLIGENNAGKTSFLDAIRLCLSRNMLRRSARLDDYDYHQPTTTTQPRQLQPLTVTLDYVLAQDEPESVVQALNDVIVFDADGMAHIVLRLQSQFDRNINDFTTELRFLDGNGNSLSGSAQRSQNLTALFQFTPIFYLNALRDADREFKPRSAYWSPFLRDKDIPDDRRDTLQLELGRLNQELLASHSPLQTAKRHLAKTQTVVATGGGNRLEVDALPMRVAQLLANAQVSISAATGATLPLERHGSGMQSLAVIFLFEAFLATMLQEQYDPDATPILALEEPEAHLHPAAVRALWNALTEIPGQEIISTHSGDLLSCVPLKCVRRFHHRDGAVAVKALQPGSLTEDEERKVEFHIQSSRGELLFARCWLLCEGESEYWVFTQAASIAGYDLDACGIRVVYNARISGEEPLVKVANDLGIHWYFVGDGDGQGQKSAELVRRHLQGRAEAQHIFTFQQANIEAFLCEAGYGAIFESHISPQKRDRVVSEVGTRQYWAEVVDAQPNKDKPVRIREAMLAMAKSGKDGVPQELTSILDAVVLLTKDNV